MYGDDSDFSNKSEEVYKFFKNRGYPDSVVNMAHYRDQQSYRTANVKEGKERENSIYAYFSSIQPCTCSRNHHFKEL